MSMKSLGLISALVGGAGVEMGIFNPLTSRFEVHFGVSDRPRGKRKDLSWRSSKGYRSRKARANKRKGMRNKKSIGR